LSGHGAEDAPRSPTLLVAVVDGPDEVPRALADGADLIDATAWGASVRAEVESRYPGVLWLPGAPDVVDVDRAVDSTGAPQHGTARDGTARGESTGTEAARSVAEQVPWAVATAAVSVWEGAAAVRTRHVAPVRRAIDMTATVAGDRPPTLTLRGLA
jgi:hypothetical protein